MARDGDKNIKVGILAGGPSSEREISLESGNAVYNALNTGDFTTVLIDLCALVKEDIKKTGIDVAFIALHGGFGEDGSVQSALAEMGMPFTGSGQKASNLALDKLASRIIFEESGIKVPDFKAFKRGVKFDADFFKMPLVVKPRREGSSVGLSLVFNENDLDDALKKAFKYDDDILVEEFIKGREITVGILDDKPLPVIEIAPDGTHYDFYAKYKSSETKYFIPAPLEAGIFKKAQEIGLKAHKALGCSFFSRVDMILGEDGIIYVLEVNTIPGLTSRSLLPKAAEAAGIDFASLCRKILYAALK